MSGEAAIPHWMFDAPFSFRMFFDQRSLPLRASRQRSSPVAPSA